MAAQGASGCRIGWVAIVLCVSMSTSMLKASSSTMVAAFSAHSLSKPWDGQEQQQPQQQQSKDPHSSLSAHLSAVQGGDADGGDLSSNNATSTAASTGDGVSHQMEGVMMNDTSAVREPAQLSSVKISISQQQYQQQQQQQQQQQEELLRQQQELEQHDDDHQYRLGLHGAAAGTDASIHHSEPNPFPIPLHQDGLEQCDAPQHVKQPLPDAIASPVNTIVEPTQHAETKREGASPMCTSHSDEDALHVLGKTHGTNVDLHQSHSEPASQLSPPASTSLAAKPVTAASTIAPMPPSASANSAASNKITSTGVKQIPSPASTPSLLSSSSSPRALNTPTNVASRTNGTPVVTPASSTSVPAPPTTAAAPPSQQATIRSCLPDLLHMTRPVNDPGVVLFHLIGVWLAVQSLPGSSAATFWTAISRPSMMVVLLALLLTSSTSMLVNDYYDTKLGNDSHKHYQPLKDHKVPMIVAKRFLSVLYAAALFCTTIVPGIPARLTVMTGLVLTFWYTQHLKPRTWLKNCVCASLIALAPLTSGMATLSLLRSGTPIQLGPLAPLLRLVCLLFVGIMGREISMDLNDRIEDKHHGVWTVPVVHGPKFATRVSFACSLAVSALAMAGPARSVLTGVLNMISASATANAAISWAILRRFSLAMVGSLMQLRRSYQVLQVEGRDKDVVNKAVEEGLISVVLLLASFV